MQPQKRIDPADVTVTTDTRSRARVISFPFLFPGGADGALIVCRLKDEKWVPSDEIKDILINFK